GPAGERAARDVLEKLPLDWEQVRFFRVPTDRVWTRDYGPCTVYAEPSGRRYLVNWEFTGWAKYPNCERDNRVNLRIDGRGHWDGFGNGSRDGRRMVLEGGAIDVNGDGLLLTTEECLLSKVQERNHGFTRADYEAAFAEYLGIKKALWLNRGIAGDDTHGHVDDLARFVGPRIVVTVVADDPQDDNYAPLQENLQRLQQMSDVKGRPLRIVPLPLPAPVWFDGQRLPASYANFYIANSVVLVPTFNDAKDR